MTRARHLAAAAAVAVVAFGLSGCEKPGPLVSVWSGTSSVHQEALCWEFNGDNLAPGACAADILSGTAGTAPTLRVTAGSTVGISVDTTVADVGWTPVIGGQKLTTTPINETYYRFTFPQVEVPAEGYRLQIVAGRDTKTRGIWSFKLVSARAS